MSIALIHVTDVHLKDSATLTKEFKERLIHRIRPHIRGIKLVAVVMSGDIAFSGTQGQFLLAENWLNELRTEIEHEGPRVEFIMVPGNHDCSFDSKDRAREVLIASLEQDPSSCDNEGFVKSCTSVQSNYRDFAKKFVTANCIFSDLLLDIRGISIEMLNVRFFCVNAAWMSSLVEKQGSIIFPVSNYSEQFEQHLGGLNVVVMHHPPNWMNQDTYHQFRALFRKHNFIVLSGHEHIGVASYTMGADKDGYIQLEGLALVPETKQFDRGLGITTFDNELQTLTNRKVLLDQSDQQDVVVDFQLGKCNSAKDRYEVTPEFAAILTDAGGNFTLDGKNEVKLGDIFVYPELTQRGQDNDSTKEYTRSNKILGAFSSNSRLLVAGEETSGKTTLLYQAFGDLSGRGLIPIYIECSKLKHSDARKLRRRVERLAIAQYHEGTTVLGEPKEKLVLLVDNIDLLHQTPKLFSSVLTFASEEFGSSIVSSDTGFDLAELLDSEIQKSLEDYSQYQLQPFGHKLRYELISRFSARSPEAVLTSQILEAKVHEVESTINTVLGKNLVPSHPIYLLILLEGIQNVSTGNLHSSSFAYYYQYLITKGLNEANLRADKHDEVMNYLANLAWFVYSQGDDTVEDLELQQFNDAFGTRFHKVEYIEREKLLIKAKVMRRVYSGYQFSYPYIYHFFLAMYLANNRDQTDVHSAVNKMADNLSDRTASNTLLFLTHHGKNSGVIDHLSCTLAGCFAKFSPTTLEADAATVNQLVGTAAQMVMDDLDVDASRAQHRENKDTIERNGDVEPPESAPAEAKDFIRDMSLVMRTSDIVGQILKNYYGSLERTKKQELLREVFDAPMRIFSYILSLGDDSNSPDVLAKEIENILNRRFSKVPPEKIKEMAKRAAFRLLGEIMLGLVLRPAQVVGIPELRDDIRSLVKARSSIAYRLIEAAYIMNKPGAGSDSNLRYIRELVDDIKEGNAFAFTVLQSLGAMHMHLYHMKDPERAKLCSALDISLKAGLQLDRKGRHTRVLK